MGDDSHNRESLKDTVDTFPNPTPSLLITALTFIWLLSAALAKVQVLGGS